MVLVCNWKSQQACESCCDVNSNYRNTIPVSKDFKNNSIGFTSEGNHKQCTDNVFIFTIYNGRTKNYIKESDRFHKHSGKGNKQTTRPCLECVEYCTLDFFLGHGSLFILLHGMPSLQNKKAEKFNFTHRAQRVMWQCVSWVGCITPAGQCYTQFSRELALLPLQRHEEVCRGESSWVILTISMGHFVVHLLYIFTPFNTQYIMSKCIAFCVSHILLLSLWSLAVVISVDWDRKSVV